MEEKRPPFKKPAKKHQPAGLIVLYEDRDIIVVDKINGLLTVATDNEKAKTAHFLLNNYVKKGNIKSRNRIFIVHRIDRDTSGVLIFAKSEQVKLFLQDQWKDFDKTYYAVVHGKLSEKEGIITSYLQENKVHRVYSTTAPRNGKLSKTGYKVIKESGKFSLLKIDLYTGRKHQIRVHLSEKGHPVAGDKMYGKTDKSIKRLALHAASLTITHPYTREKMTFETGPPDYFKTLVNYKP